MNKNYQKNYHSPTNLSEDDLEENLSVKKMLPLVGNKKRVVDFGCATGYFARWLIHRECQVTGVEINSQAAKVAEQYCERIIVTDLDFVSLKEIFPHEVFDVAVFGDVLEHLRDPWKVLKEARQLLSPDGYVVASIPNIAHGAIRLALLQGRFEYTSQGILDNTHLRFFTRKTVEELFEKSGYFIDVVDKTKLSIHTQSDLLPIIDKENFDSKLIQKIEEDEDAETLQFIVRAYPLSLEGKYAALNENYSKLVDEIQSSHIQLRQIRLELEQSQIQLQEKENKLKESQIQIQQKQEKLEQSQKEIQEKQLCLESSQTQLQHFQIELERAQLQLHQTQMDAEQIKSQLHQAQTELAQMQSLLKNTQTDLKSSQEQLQQLQAQLQQTYADWLDCQNIIQAMESSKFWKIRQFWVRLKQIFGLKID